MLVNGLDKGIKMYSVGVGNPLIRGVYILNTTSACSICVFIHLSLLFILFV
jgi:hypothetical protein